MHLETSNHVFVVFVMVFLPLARLQCDGSTRAITGEGGKIQNPNVDGGEYNKSANCNWNFTIPSSEKNYSLVFTVKQLKLYVLKGGAKHCLGSYHLTINHYQTKCDRYVHGPVAGTPPEPANDFCNAYYSSPTCASISGIQGCETKKQTDFPVPVSYVSDGRSDQNATATSMYFDIRYKFIVCEEETTTTTATTVAPSSTTTNVTAGSLSSTTTVTTTAPTSPPGSGTTIIIAASAGGGGLILILVIILVICICKRRQKTAESTQEIPLQHQNGGAKETITDQSAPMEGNSNPAYQSEASKYETVDRAGQSVSNDQRIEAVEYAATGGVTQTDQSGADMYTTVDLAHKNNQSEGGMYDTLGVVPGPTQPDSELYDKLAGATATSQSEAVTYDKLGGVGSPDQSGVEMYSTVGGAHENDQSWSDTYDRLGGALQTNQSESAMYSTVDTPQSVTQSSQPPSGHVTISDQPESAMYAAVSIKKKGVKETIHYNKESVDNVLYGTADDAK